MTQFKLLWTFLFCVAMAYLESAVVVYLRMLYYPQGFDFPLVAASTPVILIELGREAATIVMLATFGLLFGRSRIERFAGFMLAFGLWDIFYYVWLKIFIGWPESLLTWDLLFLIPAPWVGPVLAPVLVSLALIGAGMWIVIREDQGRPIRVPAWIWTAEIAAGVIIIVSFLWDVRHIIAGGLPHPFRWDIFLAGLLGGAGLFAWWVVKKG
ncbi:MAG: hypothetical protein C4524_07560 [Candidatus Zixiibacteriota bacterium]|nr:MAG: hypothetical protein C4524_07560 [candidate division Zixibacteria bacterium]